MSFFTSAIASRVLPAMENNLPKVIDAKTHGIIDYAHAAFFFSVALACRKSNKPAAVAALGTGAFVLVQSLLTDYPLGAKPVLSFDAHGKMDASFASASWLVPRIFGFSGTPAAKIFEVNSVVEAAVVGMTDWDSEKASLARAA
ncbi:MAG TPA: hypothetical protein VGD59_10485 [Acidisarcina sp.]